MKTTMLSKEMIAKHLKELRLAKGKTVAQMSAETGLGETAIRNYEAGLRMPRYEAMFTLAAYFKKTVDDIFFAKQDTKCV